MRLPRFTGMSMATIALLASLPPLPEERRKPEPKEPPEPKPLPLVVGAVCQPNILKLAEVGTTLYPTGQFPVRELATAYHAKQTALEDWDRYRALHRSPRQPLPTPPLSAPMEYALSVDHPHRHTTIGHSKLCQGCGQKLSGAEVMAIRERQAKAEKRSRWDEQEYLKRGA